MSFSQGMGALANPQNPFNVVSQGPRPLSPENRNFADQIRQLHERNFPNERQRPTVPVEVPPLANELFKGGTPITGPTGYSMANDVRANSPGGQLTNSQAQDIYSRSPADSRAIANTTVGGAYGQPSPIRNPNDADTQRQIRDAQNVARLGNGREALLAAMNGRPAGGYQAPAPQPEYDFGIQPSGRFQPGQRIGPDNYSSLDRQNIDAARQLFDARRGGPEQRRKDYEDRRAGEAKERSAGVLAAAQARGANRAENVRLRRGQLSFDERLAMQDPQAAAQKAYGQGQLGLAKEQGAARIAAQKETLAAQERMAKERNASQERVAGLGLAKANGTDANGKLIDPRTDAEKITGANSSDYTEMTPQERERAMADLPPETRDRLRNELMKQDERKKAFDAVRGGKNANPFMNILAYPFDALGSWFAGAPKDFAQLPTKIQEQIKATPSKQKK